ncbi:hypothetical protein PPERSA_07505 [Pseudocohnilembus persalinus]|uniref:Transmembrane protein n=1 Tax=Pseudocohnilembus persalinus TaxID=266149 RepID=A0A0V0QZW9_PSEPJ|nr:hypothetical protein PPERSA_07505 [Pseudocohnilembus persalinus]|eukprot:KRX07755.1 hypothetical protein PPERSA_07505 [Pseudocohnilembus persalinus]
MTTNFSTNLGSTKISTNLQTIQKNPQKDSEYPGSLSTHPEISLTKKILIPTLLFINVTFFIWSNASNGANLQAQLHFLGLETNKINVSEFRLYESVKQMWISGAYFVAIVICVFSGTWPYVKLLGMTVAWFIPQKRLSFQLREKFLIILDVMGKWSLLDTYFMIMNVVGFNLSKDLKIGFMNLSFNLAVTPVFQFLLFVIGTMMSLLITHIMIHDHRKIGEDKELMETEHYKQQMKQKYYIGIRKKSYKYIINCLIISAILIQMFGYVVKVFEFTFGGLAGWAVGKKATQAYSLWDIGSQFPEKTFEPDSFETLFLQTIYFIFTLVIPIMFLTLVLIMNTFTMRIEYLKELFTYTEIIYAWSSIEVLTLAVLAAVLQIGLVVDEVVGDNCQGLNQYIEYLSNQYPEIFDLNGEYTCFQIDSELKFGAILLIFSSIVFIILGTSTLRF